MLDLPPAYRRKLYDCITETLSAVLDLATAKGHKKPKHDHLLDVAAELVAAAQHTAHEACADFKERLNACNPCIVMRLPMEVQVECFRPLTFRGRIIISHVSRAWRRSALGEKSLWDAGIVSRRTQDNRAMLLALLSRSHPLPFYLKWDPSNHDPGGRPDLDIMDLVAQNMARFQTIVAHGVQPKTITRLFDHSALLLENLSITSAEHLFVFPPTWVNSRFPQVRRVSVTEFSIPRTFQPLTSVTEFWGHFPTHSWGQPGDHGIFRLFKLFPCLASLSLSDITEHYLALLPNVPPSVVDLRLRGVPTDFSSFIAERVGPNVKKLVVAAASDIFRLIDVSAATVRGTWSMAIDLGGDLTLRADDGTMVHHISAGGITWWRDRGTSAPYHLDQLTSMNLGDTDILLDFASGCLPWDRRLPSLRSLTATISACGRLRTLVAATCPSADRLQTARLEQLTFRISHDAAILELVAVTIPALIPAIFCYDRPMLASVIIQTRPPRDSDLRGIDLSALSRLALRVEVRDCNRRAVVASYVS